MYRSSIGGVSAKCRSSIGQVSAKCRPSIGEVSAKYRRSVGEVSVTWKAMLADIHVGRVSVDSRSTLDRYSIDTRSTVGRSRSTVDRVSIEYRRPLRIAVDIAVDITYSKHDPVLQHLWPWSDWDLCVLITVCLCHETFQMNLETYLLVTLLDTISCSQRIQQKPHLLEISQCVATFHLN